MWAIEGKTGFKWEFVDMFQGETAISIDDKGRLAIPTAFRELVVGACGNRLVLTYNPYEAGCLWLYAGQSPQCRRHRETRRAAGHGQQARIVERAGPSQPDPPHHRRG